MRFKLLHSGYAIERNPTPEVEISTRLHLGPDRVQFTGGTLLRRLGDSLFAVTTGAPDEKLIAVIERMDGRRGEKQFIRFTGS